MTLVKSTRSAFPALTNDLLEMFDMDRFFNEPAMLRSPFNNGGLYARVPAANIRDTEKEYLLEVAAPGLDKKDFHVDIIQDRLQIKVEKEGRSEKKDESFTRKEYSFDAFCRSFMLPDTVNSDKIKAEYVNGVLQVHLPKVPQAKRKALKEIAVK